METEIEKVNQFIEDSILGLSSGSTPNQLAKVREDTSSFIEQQLEIIQKNEDYIFGNVLILTLLKLEAELEDDFGIIKPLVMSIVDVVKFSGHVNSWSGIMMAEQHYSKHKDDKDYFEAAGKLCRKKMGELEQKKKLKYLRYLHSQLLFVDCAGEPARTDRLYSSGFWHPGRFMQYWSSIHSHLEKDENCSKIFREMERQIILLELEFRGEIPFHRLQVDFSTWHKDERVDEAFIRRSILNNWDQQVPSKKEELLAKLKSTFPDFDDRIFLCKDFKIVQDYSLKKYKKLLGFESEGILVISGDPGTGKTIALKQQCLDVCAREIISIEKAMDKNEIHKPVVPLFAKAKDLAEIILMYSDFETNEEIIDNWEEGMNQIVEMVWPALFPDDEEYARRFADCVSDYDNLVYFIDAFDECSGHEQAILTLFFNYCSNLGGKFVITTRKREVEQLFGSIRNEESEYDTLSRKSKNSNDTLVELFYTPQVLQQEMPKKLAIAWGLNEILQSEMVAESIESYRKVLTHPVFVGLFCRLVKQGDIVQDQFSPVDDEQFGSLTVRHCKFYETVIGKSIRFAIKKRYKKITEESILRLNDAFFRIAWHNEFDEIDELEKLISRITEEYGIKFTPLERKILHEDMGLVFATGREIVWVHRQIKEVAIGLLLAKEQSFRRRLKETFGRNTRRMKTLSDVAILAFCTHHIIRNEDEKLAKHLLSALRELGGDAEERIYSKLGARPIFSEIRDDLSYEFVDGLENEWKEIASEFISIKKIHGIEEKSRLPEDAFRLLSPDGLATVITRIQRIDFSVREIALYRSFPNLLLKDFLWSYHDISKIRSVQQILNNVPDWYLRVRDTDVEMKNKESFCKKWDDDLRQLTIKIVNLQLQGSGGNVGFQLRRWSTPFLKYIMKNELIFEQDLIKSILGLTEQTSIADVPVDCAVFSHNSRKNSLISHEWKRSELGDFWRQVQFLDFGHDLLGLFFRNIGDRNILPIFSKFMTQLPKINEPKLHAFLMACFDLRIRGKTRKWMNPQNEIITPHQFIGNVSSTLIENFAIDKCPVCDDDSSEYEIDHIIPAARGGSGIKNLRLICKRCNSRKANKIKTGRATLFGLRTYDKPENSLIDEENEDKNAEK